MTERPAVICYESWAGRREVRCLVFKETPKRYRVRLLESGFHGYRAGHEMPVPKYAVRFTGEEVAQ